MNAIVTPKKPQSDTIVPPWTLQMPPGTLQSLHVAKTYKKVTLEGGPSSGQSITNNEVLVRFPKAFAGRTRDVDSRGGWVGPSLRGGSPTWSLRNYRIGLISGRRRGAHREFISWQILIGVWRARVDGFGI